MSWISSITKGLSEALLKHFGEKRKTRKLHEQQNQIETLKRQRESEVESRQFERQVEKKDRHVSPTVEEWNMPFKQIIIFVFVTTSMVGCDQTMFVSDRIPLLGRPPRPMLPDDTPFSPREQVIAQHAIQCEQVIDMYNEFAREKNAKNGYIDGELRHEMIERQQLEVIRQMLEEHRKMKEGPVDPDNNESKPERSDHELFASSF